MKEALRQQGRKAVNSKAWRAVGTWLRGGPRGAAAGHEIRGIPVEADVVVYFGDVESKTYQLVQWLPPLEELSRHHRVVLVFRKLGAMRAVAKETTLPAVFVRRFEDLMALYSDNSYRVAIYVNNGVTNFQSLNHPQMVHVHVNHGESDKISMVSNQAKAYDKVFIAGQAALERHRRALVDFDESHLEMVGRPQLDFEFPPGIPEAEGRTVMYAPTWEGENDDNNYTSLDLYGTSIVEGLLALPDVRVVYKPHPRVVGSEKPAVSGAHEAIVRRLEDANRRRGSQHVVSLDGNILSMFGRADALISDVSSVGLDFLYLEPEKPLILTDRRTDAEALRDSAPISEATPVIDATTASVTDLVAEALERDSHAAARQDLRTHYFGAEPRGTSTQRFLDAIDALIADRAGKLSTRGLEAPSMESSD